MATSNTIEIENKYTPPFFNRIPVSIERGEGVFVWDEDGKKYLDLTSGWGVTCIGHANPTILAALNEQGGKIIQNPGSGLTYNPARAKLLKLISGILPKGLTRVFFSNSGAESNDAALKLARKVTGRKDVISSLHSFHGRTISTASATGQLKHREKFNPLMPNYRFVPFNDVEAVEEQLDQAVAAIILEPAQGEGGIRIPDEDYFQKVSKLCKENGSLLIMDEVQTGFCRTGPFFATGPLNIEVDFLTIAKGIAGGFPFGAFAVSEDVSNKFNVGDHGGTYCGNPLGCAVASAVIKYLQDNNIQSNVETVGAYLKECLELLKERHTDIIKEIRGRGLLVAVELCDDETALEINRLCLDNNLLINVTQGNIIRIFPALTITKNEADVGLEILEKILCKWDNRYDG